MSEQSLPAVAIIGRPNVGKSTLFNRIVGERVAIVEDRPGITRDRKTLEAEWLGFRFLVIDTGGWLPTGGELEAKISRQVEAAVRDSDLVLFVVDASTGITDEDENVATWIRRTGKKVLLVANKSDNLRRETEMWTFLNLGCGDPIPVSALHGRRAGDLLDEVIALLPAPGESVAGDVETDEFGTPIDLGGVKAPKVAIVGRPNVGKSTLFNRLVGEDRSVVHDLAGTTRDAIDTLVETADGPVVFVDTAGMRRRSKIDDSAEYYSMVRALRAVDDSDIAFLVIDATAGVTGQDQRLAERVDAAGCPIVVLLNKWDLLEDAEQRAEITAQLSDKLSFVGDAPVLKISAKSGKGVQKLLPVLQEAIAQYHKRVPTRDVNRVLAAAQQKQPGPHGGKVMYALQGATDPPTFTLFVNKELPPAYARYLERSLREAFSFGSTPIKLRFRRRAE
ncbi:MAG: ribosome biogenesis GTPase Der [Actinobacteria bacterium]|uniref:GTPase Der n=1 Tax=freshwater metagenome TaxID=449393 RepID=A0A6J6ZJ46_9ZZZZ|nr:ribosome biogenesis GTPase Der [Actinomycetota bacterium]MSX80507.1 ribosome biogenesis GTPase Der [Actinomycetota bacterium]